MNIYKQIVIALIILVIISGCNSGHNPTVTPLVITQNYMRQTPPSKTVPPTLSNSDDSYRLLVSTIKTNGGCKLPCIWGFTPGTSKDIEKWLSQFPEVYTDSYSIFPSFHGNTGAMYIQDTIGEDKVLISLDYYMNNDFVDELVLKTTHVGDYNYKVFTSQEYIDLLDFYTITTVLKEYKEPEQILLAVFRYDLMTKSPYDEASLVLYYPEEGFLVEYFSPIKEIDNNAEICPSSGSLGIIAWNPKQNHDLNTIIDDVGLSINTLNYTYYKQLSLSTQLNITDFMEMFTSNGDNCFYTPINLWPRQ
jgi:hypothetical protein